jgi:hypothetical protein
MRIDRDQVVQSRRSTSSCSAACGDRAAAACTASFTGRLVTGHAEPSACHGLIPRAGSSRPTIGIPASTMRRGRRTVDVLQEDESQVHPAVVGRSES